jgi:cystathionine beta-lyase
MRSGHSLRCYPGADRDNEPVNLDALTPSQLRARRTMKWTLCPDDALPLWVAEMDYPTAEPVMAALRAAVDAQSFGYPISARDSGLAEATAAWSAQRYDWPIEPADVHVVADVMHGVRLALTYLTAPAEPVILTTPVYMPFFDIVELSARPQVHVPMTTDADGRAALDLDAIGAAFRAGARTLLLCSPYNPLGRAFTPSELLALAAVVDRYGGRVVADEIHAPLVHGGQAHTPYAALSETTASHTITVVSASKAWNLPGLKCAQVITSNAEDRAAWHAIPIWDQVGVSTLGMAAAVAAYRHGEPWLAEVLAHLSGNQALLTEAVTRWPGVRLGGLEATYLAWLDLTALALEEEPATWLLREAKVMLNPGVPFRAEPLRFVRLNYATTRPILSEALSRLDGVIGPRTRG